MVNPLRGEAKLKIGEAEYTLAMTMEGLAELSNDIGDPPLEEVYRKLLGGSLYLRRVALARFVTGGVDKDGKVIAKRDAATAIVRDFVLSDIAAVTDCMAALLAGLTRKPDEDAPGNPRAASA